MQTTNTEFDLVVKMTITAWDAQNNSLNKLLSELAEVQWQIEIAPGKNRGIYLLGHLIAVHDNMLTVLGFSEKLYPELYTVFVKNPDDKSKDLPTVASLIKNLQTVSTKLNEHIRATSTAQWMERHMSVSPEDFIKEPHRNKLNIIISRTNHFAYHLGQLMLLK